MYSRLILVYLFTVILILGWFILLFITLMHLFIKHVSNILYFLPNILIIISSINNNIYNKYTCIPRHINIYLVCSVKFVICYYIIMNIEYCYIYKNIYIFVSLVGVQSQELPDSTAGRRRTTSEGQSQDDSPTRVRSPIRCISPELANTIALNPGGRPKEVRWDRDREM